MQNVKTAMMKAAMSGLYHSKAHRLLAPYTQGTGLIFPLHQVRPEGEEKAFAPNRILEVTPDFLLPCSTRCRMPASMSSRSMRP
ncbi:MAG: hypothetical protein ACR2J1_01840 [Methyloceanibacter sp.]|uniref:hypothetical protein n=1 Tax=Methyloceanibacter sp. TaxID=1965321 RepID=UPI003D9BB819